MIEHATSTLDRVDGAHVVTYACDDGYAFGFGDFAPSITCAPGDTAWPSGSSTCATEAALDPATGLEWERFQPGGGDTRGRAEGRCAGLEIGAAGDFRLPSLRELITLYDYDASDTDTGLGLDPYGTIWSSTMNSNRTLAYALDFDDGTFWSATPNEFYRIICVRGAELPGPSWTANGDGTATDGSTGLTWETTLSSESALDHASAITHCASLTTGGGGFRVPAISELMTIIEYGTPYPSVDQDVFPTFPGTVFWTSTPYEATSDVWIVNFNGILPAARMRDGVALVRCVKDAE